MAHAETVSESKCFGAPRSYAAKQNDIVVVVCKSSRPGGLTAV